MWYIISQKYQNEYKSSSNAVLTFDVIYTQERQSGLKSGGAQRGGAGNFGVFSPQKTYLYIYFRGGAEKVVVHVHYWHALEWRPC